MTNIEHRVVIDERIATITLNRPRFYNAVTWNLTFIKLGLVPDCGLSMTLPRIVGYGKALEMCMLSEPIDARTADAMGLCTMVTPDERTVPEAQTLAKRLAQGPALGLALTKQELLRNGLPEIWQALQSELDMQTQTSAHADFAEGVAAFRAKRAPNF